MQRARQVSLRQARTTPRSTKDRENEKQVDDIFDSTKRNVGSR